MKTASSHNTLIISSLIKSFMTNFGKKVALKATLFTLLTAAALAPNLATAQDSNKASPADIIENGHGDLFIKNTDNNPLVAEITFSPIYVPGDSIPDDYSFTSGANGIAHYEVLTFAELGVGLNQINKEQIQTVRPNPSSDFTINYHSQELPSSLIISNLQGKMVAEINGQLDRSNNVAEFYVDLSKQANSVYLATSIIDGQRHTENLVKINAVVPGKQAIQTLNKASTATLEDAIYEINITAEGYLPFQGEISVATGDNGGSFRLIDPIPGLPQHQDLTGRAYLQDDDNNIYATANATVYVTNTGTGETVSTVTDANGDWIVHDFPINVFNNTDYNTAEVSFEYDANHYAIQDVYYTTPVYNENTWSASDTIHSGLTGIIVQPDDETTVEHLAQQGGHDTNQDIIEYFLVDSEQMTETKKNKIRSDLAILTTEENEAFTFVESDEPLNGTGITIAYGTNNTITDQDDFETPWNHKLYPTISAITTTNVSSNIVVYHEVKQALGFQQVAWGPDYDESVMENPVQNYSQEDRTIAELSRTYYNEAYQNNTHGIPLSYLTPGVSKSTKDKSVPLQIQDDNANYHFK